MKYQVIKVLNIIVLLTVFTSCSKNTNFGNGIYFQSDYESTDVGFHSLGSSIFLGNIKDGYTGYSKILVYSDVLSYYKKDGFLYVKQQFNFTLFKELVLQSYNSSKTLPKPYVPREVQKLLLQNKDVPLDTVIKKSNFYEKRNKNQDYNYYIINIKTQEVSDVYSSKNFKKHLKDNNKEPIFNKL
jgi:hypothetical protein